MTLPWERGSLLPKVARTFANYRIYSANDVHIRRARDLGFSMDDIKGMDDIKELLGFWQNKSRSSAAVKKIAGKRIGELKHKLAELKTLIDTLEYLARQRHGDQRPECPILDELSGK